MPVSIHWSSVLLLTIWSTLVTGQRLVSIPQNLTTVEEQPPGTVIGQISVSSAVPPYDIYHADPQDARRIVVSSGGLVTVGVKINRELKSLYRLIAHASNNVNVEVITVLIYLAIVLFLLEHLTVLLSCRKVLSSRTNLQVVVLGPQVLVNVTGI